MKGIKNALKRTPGLKNVIRGYKAVRNNVFFSSEYRYDKKLFNKSYSHSKETKDKLGYNILLLTHSLEKGMSNRSPRRFGIAKVCELMHMVEGYEKYSGYSSDYPYINAINMLRGYTAFYEKQGWQDADEYRSVLSFIKKRSDVAKMLVGSHVVRYKDFAEDLKVDYGRFLASRHSVRNYKKQHLNEDDFLKAVNIARLSPSACNRQMCKAYYVKDNKKSKQIIDIAQGFGGFEKDTINIIVVTFDLNANYMIGERNQGWFNAGLFSMNLVNAMHSMGIGSCFCQFGNSTKEEEVVKRILGAKNSERIAVIIAAGYYAEESIIPYSPRKNIDDIAKII